MAAIPSWERLASFSAWPTESAIGTKQIRPVSSANPSYDHRAILTSNALSPILQNWYRLVANC